MNRITLLVILLVSIISINATGDQDLISCGGFVKVSKHLGKSQLLYDHIKINLLSAHDLRVREQTECAPNGYYFLPIYEKGSFILQIEGPQGWTFAKKEIGIKINSNEDCKDDINFELTGFKVEGKVSSQGCSSSDKLDGIKVVLKSSSLGVVAETVTKNGGQYSFDNIVPASDYVVIAHHDSWLFSQNSIAIDFKWDNYKVTQDIIIQGFDVTGQIVYDNDPIKDVDFNLESNDIKEIIGCSKKEGSICSIKSNDHGKFNFKNVPCGKYRLVPIYQGVQQSSSNAKYDIVPSHLDIQVESGGLNIKQSFEIKGFSVSGKVINHLKEGVSGVNIIINGRQRAITNVDGQYIIDQITSGTFKVEAQKDHMTFESLNNFRMTPTLPSLPDLIVKTYHLCGQVSVPTPPQGIKVNPREITLQGTKQEKKSTDNNGKFCFDVVPGTYTVSISTSSQEKSKGLQFESQSIITTITNKPQLEILFSQTRATVGGRIKPIKAVTEVPSTMSVVLEPTSRSGEKVNAILSLSKSGEINFTYRDLLPGSYKVIINFNQWCWLNNEKLIDINNEKEEKNDIEFIQKGYYFDIVSPHDQVSLIHELEENKLDTIQLNKGVNSICLKESGKHQFTIQSCFQFEKSTYSFNTDSATVAAQRQSLNLKIEKFQLKGSIKVTKDSDKEILLNVNVYNKKDHKLIETIKATLSNDNLYSYSYMATLGDELVFEPISKDGFLFYPKNRFAGIDADHCPPMIDAIVARPGIFITGKVNPQIPSVAISTYNAKTEELYGEPALTDSQGNYVVGPLYDDQEYTLKASKPGFHFKKESKTNTFNAIELGSLIVNIVDSETKQPVQGVLISLSGEGYRNNVRSPVNGSTGFFALFPGQYFAKVLLKEYSIQPSSLTIDVVEGRQKVIELIATRVAFSVFGSVKSLTSDAQSSVTVQAVDSETNAVVEESQTDSNGSYRIRGLLPNRPWIIRVVGSQVFATPSEHPVTLVKQDLLNIDFITVAHPSQATFFLSGDVTNVERQHLSVLRANLYHQHDYSLYRSIDLGFSTFFDFGSIPRASKYILRIEHVNSAVGTVSKETQIGGETEKSVRHVTVQVQLPNKALNSNTLSSTDFESPVPVAGLLFFVFVVLSVLYPTKVYSTLVSIKNGTIFKNQKKKKEKVHDDDKDYINDLIKKDKQQLKQKVKRW